MVITWFQKSYRNPKKVIIDSKFVIFSPNKVIFGSKKVIFTPIWTNKLGS